MKLMVLSLDEAIFYNIKDLVDFNNPAGLEKLFLKEIVEPVVEVVGQKYVVATGDMESVRLLLRFGYDITILNTSGKDVGLINDLPHGMIEPSHFREALDKSIAKANIEKAKSKLSISRQEDNDEEPDE